MFYAMNPGTPCSPCPASEQPSYTFCHEYSYCTTSTDAGEARITEFLRYKLGEDAE